jgi:thioredoxin reductase
MDNFKHHAENAGSEFLQDTVLEVQKEGEKFIITTSDEKIFTSDFVILATGNKYRQLGVL